MFQKVNGKMNALEFAIKMEQDGEQYYRQQAEENKDNSLNVVCLMLADDESHHAQILINRLNEKDYALTDSETLLKAKNIFEGIGDIEMEIKSIPSQLDFYRIATEKEKQSITLYSELLAQAEDRKDMDLFEYLIQQENQHYEVLDNLAMLLQHTEEWVESPEFGLRKDF
jgi:rubrerythrin